jgi:hypothetical protein
MLGILGFKRALFAGVLDGGSTEVSLGGTRLSRFMEGVEKVSGNTGTPEMQEPAPVVETEAEAAATQINATEAPVAPASAAASDALGNLINAGLNFLTQIAATNGGVGAATAGTMASRLVEVDEKTGRSYLRLPVPDPDVLKKIAEALAGLFPAQSAR